MSYLDDVVAQAIAWDEARERSQQKDIGWSQVAGCRRYMGYRLDEEWASDDTDNWRAIAGTALHRWLQEIRCAALDDAGEDAEFEREVEYGGIRGHVDEVVWSQHRITDYKFPSLRSASLWEDPKVLDEKFVQPQGYAAAIMGTGRWKENLPLHPENATVGLLVCPVDGQFGDWRMHERPFDRAVADAAVARYRDVEAMREAGEQLPRDRPAWWCSKFCEFASLCRPEPGGDESDLPEITDEELAAAVERYGLAVEQASAADKVKKQIGPLIRGLRGTARDWRISTSAAAFDWKADMDQVAADYARSGLDVPYRRVPRQGALNVRRAKPSA